MSRRWVLSPLAREMLGILVAGCALFVLLALATGTGPGARPPAGNWMGPAGDVLGAGLHRALGASSYAVPCLLGACAWIVLAGWKGGGYSPARLLGIPVLLVSLAGILDRWQAGGEVGREVKGGLASLVGRKGAWLFFLVAFALGAMVALRLSLVGLAAGTARAVAAGSAGVRTRVVIWVERRRREAERRRREGGEGPAEPKRARRRGARPAPADQAGEEAEVRREPAVFPLLGAADPGEAVPDGSGREGEAARAERGREETGEEPSWLERGMLEAGDRAPGATGVVEAPENWVPPEIVTGRPPPEDDLVPGLVAKEGAAKTEGGRTAGKGRGKAGGKDKQIHFEFWKQSAYRKPPIELLESSGESGEVDKDALITNSEVLEKRLLEYGVPGKVTAVTPGPVITRYDFEPAAGVKVSKIMALADDITLAMRAISVRILAPVPGKAVVGIEIPNRRREVVYFKDVAGSPSFQQADSPLALALGKDIGGNPFVAELPQMPHLLVAGTTGSGKSVQVNSMICSVLFKASPDQVKVILIDPKMLEFSGYDGIPHLMLPIVTDMRKAARALRWAVEEMEDRYQKLAEKAVRHIEGYNQKIEAEMKALREGGANLEEMRENGEALPQKLPYIMVIIDELSDLMMVAGREVEEAITRLAQMARAAGIHLLVATQRPSVDVLTGVIKANFPARIAFKVATKADSRVILDQHGAERLLGKGDMLFLAPGTSKLQRVHGAYISDAEIKRVVDFLKKQGAPVYEESVLRDSDEEGEGEDDIYDEKYDEALAYVSQLGHASISLVQRRFRIGYNRAARIIEKMEREGVLGPADGSKPRQVLVNRL